MSDSDSQSLRDRIVAPVDPHRQLVGTWRLLSWEAQDTDGTMRFPMGKDALG